MMNSLLKLLLFGYHALAERKWWIGRVVFQLQNLKIFVKVSLGVHIETLEKI